MPGTPTVKPECFGLLGIEVVALGIAGEGARADVRAETTQRIDPFGPQIRVSAHELR